ncbi:hypothetical protein D7S86_20865 [Pararobbsia silviterrae]|uniref:SMP-30/Gluconolactonase/LRE-like region domain-containing protein n=1 Tax=Pararobbsia silviterrae TaxID=1792498 RepID=A0A494XJ90_9BURK|nr:hypothetical protein D7S86_20865 [Pararobbsia silviterrae]
MRAHRGVAHRARAFAAAAIAACCAALLVPATASADPQGLLETIHQQQTVTSTVPDNGDQNPYALAISPITAGKVQRNDVLIDNFNNAANLQGVGTTIVDYNPATQKLSLFANVPHDLKECPGGVGLSTAMTVLKSGWVVVGSTPSNDGTTDTKGSGCLLVFDMQGNLATVFSGENINDPWGNMAVVDNGDTASLFISNAGFGVGKVTGYVDPPVFKQATVLRVDLAIEAGKPPVVKNQTIVASGFSERADRGVFLIGPTGVAFKDGKLYVSDAIGNRISVIEDALTRDTSAGVGRTLTADGLLQRPLAMCLTPAGHLLVTNGLNGKVVEIDPENGRQIYARWIDTDKAQSPPGNGDLFGIVMTPEGDGFYYVEDDVNTLVLAR